MKEKLILFVCTGNICRSPMAEYILRARMGDESGWIVASTGLAACHGMSASQAAITVLREEGIDLTPHRSRPLDRQWVDAASVIVVMTSAHREQIRMLYPDATERVFLLGSFGGGGRDVPDPIGCPVDTYQQIMGLIDRALSELIAFLEALDIN